MSSSSMSKELLAIFKRQVDGVDVFETVAPPVSQEFATIEEYAYGMEAKFGARALPGGAEKLCANFREASFEYCATQPAPDSRYHPTLRSIANGAPVPDWLKWPKKEREEITAAAPPMSEPPMPADYASWPQDKKDRYCAQRAAEYRSRRSPE